MAEIKKITRSASTLIEILVVIGIIGVLMGLLLPAVVHIREASSRVSCQSNLRQLGLAMQGYYADFESMPPYEADYNAPTPGNWFTHLLPYVEENDLYVNLRSSIGKAVLAVDPRTPRKFKVLMCGSDPTMDHDVYWSKTSYQGNWYALTDGQAGFYRPAQTVGNFPNGLSNVVLFAEGYSECSGITRLPMISAYKHVFGVTLTGKPSDDPSNAPNDYTMFQAKPPVPTCDKQRMQAPHDQMNVCMADASVRAVKPTISPAVWKLAIKPHSGGPLGDW